MIPQRVGFVPGMVTGGAQDQQAPALFQVEPAASNAEKQVAGMEAQKFVLQPLPVSQVSNLASTGIPAGSQVAAAHFDPAMILGQLQQMKTLLPESKESSSLREFIIRRGMAVRAEGCLLLTPKGVSYLADFGLL